MLCLCAHVRTSGVPLRAQQPEQHYKTRRQRAPAAGSICTRIRVYMCVHTSDFFFLMKSPSTVYTDVRPEIYRTVFYRPCAVGLAIFPDRHRYSAAITL